MFEPFQYPNERKPPNKAGRKQRFKPLKKEHHHREAIHQPLEVAAVLLFYLLVWVDLTTPVGSLQDSRYHHAGDTQSNSADLFLGLCTKMQFLHNEKDKEGTDIFRHAIANPCLCVFGEDA